MNGVVIYFAGVASKDVCAAMDASRLTANEDASFAVLPYQGDSWTHELESDEIAKLIATLGTPPSCAIHVACRKGEDAQNALRAVAMAMNKFPDSVLDDDFGRLWSSGQVIALTQSEPVDGLFALSAAARV